MAVIIGTTLFMSHSFASGNTARLNRSVVAGNQTSAFTMQVGIVSHSKTFLYGGAFHFYQSNATIRNSNFSGNTAENGGALSIEKSDLAIDNCRFTKSIATFDGGVLIARSKCTVTITNSTFDENKTVKHGILFVTHQCFIQINSTTFRDNFVGNDGGGISLRAGSTSVIRGCMFH